MKANFKPLAIAAAVTAASAGYSGAANAAVASNGLGDLAIVPYYTVQADWVTGIHITNTSDLTQVVKFRMRRAEDSLDVLDFNIVLSPRDMWTATIKGDESAMSVESNDNSCVVPFKFLAAGGVAPVQVIEGSQEGYLEIIGMGSTTVSEPVGLASKHVAGTPLSCITVETNFFPETVLGNGTTVGFDPTDKDNDKNPLNGVTSYEDTGNVLKVSYFMRDNASGIEFGSDALHIQDFSDIPMMTHQQFGLERLGSAPEEQVLNGWNFPDLDGSGINGGLRGQYDGLIRPDIGADSVLNDWSYNATTGAATDWVITFPGQYLMFDIFNEDPTVASDYRDIPVIATFRLRDREETAGIPGGLDFSPAPAPDSTLLPNEVNVVTWGPDSTPPVLDSVNSTRVNPAQAGISAATGWAWLEVAATTKRAPAVGGVPGAIVDQSVVNRHTGEIDEVTSVPVPMIGFTAWQRTFTDASKNYGRIIDHSFIVSDGGPVVPST
jgi:hypothetical protein